MNAETPFDLREAFLLRQEQLLATLGVGRTVAWHAGTMGDDSELNWRGMLESLLPRRYGVSKAFVVDADGGKSEQLDIVIHDRHFSPLLFDIGEAVFIPAESVYAVFEVKQVLDRVNLIYASRKVASVRRLHRTSAPIPHAGGTFAPKAPPRILGGVLTFASDWKAPFGEPFESCLGELSEESRVDLGCALEDGGFDVSSWEPLTVVTSPADASLIFFVLHLLKRLQAMATVPAIDYEVYGGKAALW